MTTDSDDQQSFEDPRKNELDRLLRENEELAGKIEEEARESLEISNRTKNQARIFREAIPFLAEEVDFEPIIDVVERANKEFRQILPDYRRRNVVLLSVSSSSGTASTFLFDSAVRASEAIDSSSLFRPGLLTLREDYLNASGDIEQKRDELLERIKLLGLDDEREGKKPSTLLEEAVAAFKSPVTQEEPIATSLIPLRSSFDRLFASLLKKRPKVEKTNGQRGKILSIAQQLKFDFLAQDTIRDWADQWDQVHDELSAAKTQNYSWSKWSSVIKRSIIFMNGFLASLDLKKFRI